MAKKTKFSEYFIQLVLVVVGVFLGILASEWNANKNLKKDQKEILENIKQEIKANLTILKQAQKNRTSFNKSLDSISPLLSDDILKEPFFDRDFNERIPNWKGVGIGQLSNAMFEMAKYSNLLSTTSIDVASQLSKTYSIQQGHNRLREIFLKKFFDLNSQTTYADALRLMQSIRQELGNYENLLLQEYKMALEML